MEQFDSTLSSVIDSTLGLRCRSFHFMAHIFDDMNNGFGWDRLPKSFMAENTARFLKEKLGMQ